MDTPPFPLNTTFKYNSNGLRSNYSFAMIPGEKREFGTCDMEIEGRKAEPPPEVRDNIARTYLYMNAAYPSRGVISRKNRNCLMHGTRKIRLTIGNVNGLSGLRRFKGMRIRLLNRYVRIKDYGKVDYPTRSNSSVDFLDPLNMLNPKYILLESCSLTLLYFCIDKYFNL